MKIVYPVIYLALLGCLAAPSAMAGGTQFTIDCSLEFEDDLEGWSIEGSILTRNTGDWFGLSSQSPDYIIAGSGATSADVVFSPVKKLAAGEPCTLEFYYNAPGGSPANLFNYGVKVYACASQSLDSQIELLQTVANSATTGWKKVTVTYSPEAVGDMCFAIQPVPYSDAMASRCGYIGFDSFIIEGTEGGEEPVGTPFEILYTFDDDADFPGINTLPKGWFSNGNKAFRRYSAETLGLPAAPSGEKVLGTVSPTVRQDNILATEYYVLAGNTEATFSFKYSAKSESLGIGYGFKVYASQTQGIGDAVLIGEIPADDTRSNEWFTSDTFTFTPQTDGKYCFVIAPYNESGLNPGSPVGFDDIAVTGYEGTLLPPVVVPDDPKGNPEAFTIDCSLEFEEDLEGWIITGTQLSRNTGDWFGVTPDTPDYIISGSSPTSADVIFTPLKALVPGEPCTLEFVYNAPGGTPNIFNYGLKIYVCSEQSLDTQIELLETVANSATSGWKKVSVSYTPQDECEVCFAIQPVPYSDAMASRCGNLSFDSFIVEGTTYGTGGAPQVEKEAFTVDCSLEFEEDLEGWIITGTQLSRNTGDWFGLSAESPDYIIAGSSATSADVIFSPVKKLVAGEPCTLEFYYNSPGGTPANLFNYGVKVYACSAQSLDSQIELRQTVANNATTGWKKVTVTYTPEADADVCFAIQPVPYTDAMASRCGTIGFDSFYIEGTTYAEGGSLPVIELEPNPDHLGDCIELPYFEDFNGGHYDGTSYLPIGWTSTGSVTWITGSHKSLPAVEGDYYIIASHNTEGERDDRAYTPFMNLEAGKTYTIDYSVYMQGNRWNDYDILYLPTLTFTVGTEQEADFHAPIATFSQECTTWVPQSFTFTPEKSGAYCFAFMLSGPENSGYVFVDALKITSDGLVARVVPSFAVKGLYTLMDSDITLAFKNEPVQIMNTSLYAETYKWTVAGAEPSTSTDENPSFTFPADGEYTVVLEATNSKGSRKTQRKLNVQILDENVKGQQMLTLFNANQDKLLGTGETPTFDTDAEGDFVSGYNHYYFDLAQRYDFAKDTPVYLDQLSLTITNRRFRGMTSYFDDQRIRPFSLVVYGSDENGNLDETSVLGRIDTTIGEALGSSGLYSFEARDIVFSEPIEVSGTFYIAFHFDRSMEVIPQDLSLGRSFIGYQLIRHAHGLTTLYAKPFDKPAFSDAPLNEWMTVDNLDSRLKGLGSYWLLWGKTTKNGVVTSALNPDGSVAFAASFFGSTLNVSGTQEGEIVEVYNIGGSRVASAAATEGSTVISSPSFVPGIYVVKCGDNVTKVLKANN